MPSWRAWLLVVAALTACRFSVDPVDLGAGDMSHLQRDMNGGGGDLSPGSDMACGVPSCPFGCASTPMPHCKTLQPSGPVTVADYTMPGLMNISAGGDLTFNTDTGEISGGVTRAAGPAVVSGIFYRQATQLGGANVGIFAVNGFTLPAGTTMKFVGSSAFALVSNGAVTIAGTVRGGCSAGAVGPGGSAGGAAGVANGNGSGLGAGTGGTSGGGGAAGGGGAGFGDIGGTGGTGQGNTTPTPGGAIQPLSNGAGAFVLIGGSGGGAGGGPAGGPGGGGGGAVQISVNGALTVSGTIDVSGCGGQKPTMNGSSGGGGGSGGAMVLESGMLTIAGGAVLSANGGGGGGGGDNNNAGNGTDGAPGTTQASGGAAGGGGGGGGGLGGARGAQAGLNNTEGGNAPSMGGTKFGGGGGGGTGRMIFRSLMLSDQGMTFSPDPMDLNKMKQKMTVYESASFQ